MKTITSILIELGTKIQQNIDLNDPKPVQPRVRRQGQSADQSGQEMQMQTPLLPTGPTAPPLHRPQKTIYSSSSGSDVSENFIGGVNPALGVAGTASDQLSYWNQSGKVGLIPAASTASAVAGVTSLLGVFNVVSESAALATAMTEDDEMSKITAAATIADGVERIGVAIANTTGSIATSTSQFLDAIHKAAGFSSTMGVAGSGILSGVGIMSSTLDLYESIQEAVRYAGVRKTSLAILGLLSVYNSTVEELLASDLSGFKRVFKSEASIKKSFLNSDNYTCANQLAPYYWFCFKYHRSFFGHLRFIIEKVGLPLIGLAAACLSIAMLSTSVASGGITLVSLGAVAAAGGVLFSGYKMGKYAQSVGAFQDMLAEQMYVSEKEERQIAECLGFTHRVFGSYAHKMMRPIDSYRGRLRAPGVTLGDWYRFKLAQDLLNLVYENGTDDLAFRSEPYVFFTAEHTHTIRAQLTNPNHTANLDGLGNVAEDMKFLFTRGVWEVIKADLSEHAWRLALQDIDKLLRQYAAVRDSYWNATIESSARDRSKSLGGVASPRRNPRDSMRLEVSASEYERHLERVETPLLKIFFGMLRVNP